MNWRRWGLGAALAVAFTASAAVLLEALIRRDVARRIRILCEEARHVGPLSPAGAEDLRLRSVRLGWPNLLSVSYEGLCLREHGPPIAISIAWQTRPWRNTEEIEVLFRP